jgi:hypothetical protein
VQRHQQMMGRVAVAAKFVKQFRTVCSDFFYVKHVQQQRNHMDPCAVKPVFLLHVLAKSRKGPEQAMQKQDWPI